MSEGTVRLVEEIRSRIRLLARRMTLAKLLYGGALFVGISSAAIFLIVGLEALLWMASLIRTVAFWMLVLVLVGAAVWWLGPPIASLVGLRPGPDDESVARAVGKRFPEVSDRLVDLLHLVTGRRSASPDALLDGAVQQLGRSVVDVDYSAVEQFEDFRRIGRYARWPVLGLAMFVLIVPGTFTDAVQRVLHPGAVFTRPAPFSIGVEPGDVRLVKGDSLTITATLSGSSLPDVVALVVTRIGESREETLILHASEVGRYRHTLANVRDDFTYKVEAGAQVSSSFRVDVSTRPFVRSLQVVVEPPSYTGLPSRSLAPEVGDVSGLLGSTVRLELGLSGQDISQGVVRFAEAQEVPIAVSTAPAQASFRITDDDRYRIELSTASGVTNERPIDYRIRAVRDQRPAIFVITPEAVSEFDDALRVPISARITDDFGFSRASLYFRLAESRFGEVQETFSEIRLPRPTPRALDQQIDYDWDLTTIDLDLVPGDVLMFYLEVADNDAVSGYKTTASGMHTIRFPSLTDRFEALDEKQDDFERSLEDLLNDSEDIKKSFDDLRDELRRDQEGDWNDERMVEQLQDRQSELDERISDLTDKMESMVDQMSESDLLSPETMERFNDLKKVVEEISSPELREALERLKEAMMNLDLTEMQQSLGDFEFNEEQFRDRIERALELFKRLRTEQKLQEASKRADDLAKREEELAEKTDRLNSDKDSSEPQPDVSESAQEKTGDQEDSAQTDENATPKGDEKSESESGEDQAKTEQSEESSPPDKEQLAAEQERAAEDMEQLEKLLEEIQEQMQEIQPAPSDEMDEAVDRMQQENLQQQMQQNAQQLRQSSFNKAQKGQRQMQQSLQQLSQQLDQMQQEMSGEQLAANLAALRRALDDVLTLSLEEEQLRDDVRDLSSRDAGLRTFAQQQAELQDGLKFVADSLSELSREIPQMSRDIQTHAGAATIDMERAVAEMTERRGQQALGFQKSAMTNLNELALLLSELMQNMQNQMSGMGGMSMQQMMQQLQQMAGQQGQINEQIQQFLNDMQGSRLGQDMQERLRQMSAQQDALRQQLEEMGEKSNGAADKLLGDLDQIARQMQETIKEMQARQIDQKTYERQQQILTRLLDAQRSMRERGREQKREGKTGEDFQRSSPADLSPSERAERLRRELLRALEAGYAPDYEELIKRYFEALQQEVDSE